MSDAEWGSVSRTHQLMSQRGSFLECDAVKICNLSTFRRKTLSPSLWYKRNHCPKQVGRTFQRNFSNLLPECSASHQRGQWSLNSRLWKAQIWLAAFLPLLHQITSTFSTLLDFFFCSDCGLCLLFSPLFLFLIMYCGCTMGEAGLWQRRHGFNFSPVLRVIRCERKLALSRLSRRI
jgi:hypothetical protein